MADQTLISKIAAEVKARLDGEGSGHDWWHVHRVWRMAEHIARLENADLLIVSLAALLHDIADWKFHGGDDSVGPRVAAEMLASHRVSPAAASHVGISRCGTRPGSPLLFPGMSAFRAARKACHAAKCEN